MEKRPPLSILNHPLVQDYGMVFVLVALGALFSVATIKEQHPNGRDAGAQVGQRIASQFGEGTPPRVLIVVRDTADDREFASAAEEVLEKRGAVVVGKVHGEPKDARAALDAILARGESVDAFAVNDVTSQWTVYDRIGAEKCVSPQPYKWPDFLKRTNLLGVANQTAIYAIIAIGMTFVIVSGGIDLSVGSLVALAAVVGALILRDFCGGAAASAFSVVLAVLAGIGVCAAVGLGNGILVAQFRLPPFIATLGTMMMASGLAFRLSKGLSIPELPPPFFWLGADTAGIPNPVLLMGILYLLAHVAMSQMVVGRYVYAIGGNQEAARLSGVPVKRVQLGCYTLCGALAGLGGIVLASQLKAGDPKFGLAYELDVIAAVVVGGASLSGGYGKIFGTLIGAFIIAVIKNGMNLTNIDPYNQKIVLGAVLTVSVLLDTLKRRGNS